ncbi:hypothetical protein IWW35_003141 [Coemansia sp. RSA 1878]|nr:hypothetical protein IWW35_003141 [Coemansia sp. RSA 1878]
MRYRYIVFRAQPKKESIAFSVYLEEVVNPESTRSNVVATPVTSPSDEYALAVQSVSPLTVPANSTDTANARVCRTIERTWDQCEWLHQKIETSFRLQALPPFPERPSAKKTANALYVERYRARIERWLNRLGARKDICNSASMDYFISAKLTDSDIGSSAKQSFSSLLLNMFGSSAAHSDRGFKTYTPIGEIDDFDEDEEERRREYIASTEECAQELVAAIKNVHTQEEAFGKGIVKAAVAISKAFKVDTLLPCPRNSEASAASDSLATDSQLAAYTSVDHQRLDISLVLLQSSAEAQYWSTKELATWTEFNVVDVVMEYYAMVCGVKAVMNHTTQTMMLYEKAILRHQTYEQRANGLRVQYPSDTPSVKHANEQEAQAEREMDMAHQEYTDANDGASRELVRYERERAHGICKALESMANIELNAARARCQELRALCRRIRGVQMVKDPPHPRTNIGSMLWQTAGESYQYPPMMLTPGVSATTSSPFAPTPARAGTMPLASQPSHKHSMSSGSGSTGSASAQPSIRPRELDLRRAQTMDNTYFDDMDITSMGASGSRGGSARNHSVFLEPDHDSQLDYSPISAPVQGSSSQPVASTSSTAAGSSSGSSTTPLRHKKRWNGRISTLPFQGFDPQADQSSRIVVDRDRLEEMAAEAEMEAELVRSGMLTARKISRKRSAPNYTVGSSAMSAGMQPPPMLPAFRSKTLTSASPNQLRYTNSCTSLSTIPQPVSPSEYLQYSRQNLHSSLSRAPSSGPSTGNSSASTRSPSGYIIQRNRDVKGKGRAFAV